MAGNVFRIWLADVFAWLCLMWPVANDESINSVSHHSRDRRRSPDAYSLYDYFRPLPARETRKDDWAYWRCVWPFQCPWTSIRCIYNGSAKLALDFYINVPIGAVALFLIVRYYKETMEASKQK